MLFLLLRRVRTLAGLRNDIMKLHQCLREHVCQSMIGKGKPSLFASYLPEKIVPIRLAEMDGSRASCPIDPVSTNIRESFCCNPQEVQSFPESRISYKSLEQIGKFCGDQLSVSCDFQRLLHIKLISENSLDKEKRLPHQQKNEELKFVFVVANAKGADVFFQFN